MADANATADPQYGRCVARHVPPPFEAWALLTFGVAVCAGAPMLYLMNTTDKNVTAMLGIAVPGTLLFGIMILAAAGNRLYRMRNWIGFYEHGMLKVSGSKVRRIPYSDITLVRYEVVEYRTNGIASTKEILTVVGAEATDRYVLMRKAGGRSTRLSAARDLASQHVSHRLWQDFEKSGYLLWVDGAVIRTDGIWNTSGTHIAWENIEFRTGSGDGKIEIADRLTGRVFFRLTAKADNFYPLLAVARHLKSNAQSPTEDWNIQ